MLPLETIFRIIAWTLSWLYRCAVGQIMYRWPAINKWWNRCKRIMAATGKNRGSKSEMNFVGLNNQGSTCYLNTLLQTWFMTPEFKDCISRSQTQDRLKDELKNLFEQLARENYHSVCTKSLTSYLEFNVYKQCDIEVCFRNLMSKLSTKMDKENNILKIYQVTMVHSMKCSKCKTPLDKENLFLDIPLSMCSANSLVKFTCMEDSLRAFLDVEKMEGDNKCYCDACEEKTESTSVRFSN
ncbi:ubiquitin carboxyl-terminal hydrolase 47-like [Amblyraja radiata]|uniref:ubiquitin carboxyl-terminal hydrolase 47-like n=1 Tax=Amblyraja radiata TaxID=386614 RepID=UPI001402A042|nr:ubiquitin carboxyl-terminal hydrolase 47-like [Amblyraja radiata]